MELTQEKADLIEEKHNVYVDVSSLMWNQNGYNDTYGWYPIFQLWLDEVEL